MGEEKDDTVVSIPAFLSAKTRAADANYRALERSSEVRMEKAAEAALKQEKLAVEAEKNIARQKTAEDQAALKELFAERAGMVAKLDPGLVNNYERIRKTRGGIAIAEAIDGRCSRCYISLRPQFFQELKRGDKVMTCESCNRILYYQRVESFEDQVGAKA
jgi:predicted  nucleic acid-binding Zn-ribbon protein